MKKTHLIVLAAAFAVDTYGQSSPITSADISFTVSSRTVCTGELVQFSDLTPHAPTTWTWSFEGGSPASSHVQNPSVIYNTPGDYNVVMSLSNDVSTATQGFVKYITVQECVSLPESSLGSIDIFPNPATDLLNVTARTACTFKIIDLPGRVIEEGNIQTGSNTIDLKKYPPGSYFLRLQNGQEHRTLRFIRW